MQKEKKKSKKKVHKSPGKKCDNILTGLALWLVFVGDVGVRQCKMNVWPLTGSCLLGTK